MKFPAFEYIRPDTVAEAVEALAHHRGDAQVLAGGQSLLPLLAMRLSAPRVLVDINRIAELDGVAVDAHGVLHMGALVRHARVCIAPDIARAAPLLAAGARHIAHTGVRNQGTLGGSISLADPAAEFPACSLALDARFTLVSARGARELAADAFFVGTMDTAASEDELLSRISLPAARAGDRFAFHEIARRDGDYAIAGAAVAWRTLPDGTASVRAVVFGVSDRPVFAARASAILAESGTHADAVAAACEALGEEVEFVHGVQASASLRRHMAKVALRRAVAALATEREAAMWRSIRTEINGEVVEVPVAVRQSLADFLRDDRGLTGTHLGCEHGVCGACTVRVDGKTVRACLMLAVQADGRSIQTIETAAMTPLLSRLRESFLRHGAVQCGYCTAGVLLTAAELLEGGRPSREEIRAALSGHYCRCTGYHAIVDAIEAVADER